MPLVLLEAGTIFTVDENCFKIPEKVNVEEAKKKQRVNPSIRYYPPPLVIPDESVVQNTLKPDDISVDIVFERDTQYLAIPSSAFKSAMRDVSFDAYTGGTTIHSKIL